MQQKPSRPVKATPRTRQPLDLEAPDLQTDSHAADSSSSSSTQLLALLSRLFAPLRRSPTFSATLQHVKGLLYDQQYLAAFGTESEEGERWREVYAARWVPSRAVIYQRIFEECDIARHLGWQTPSDETNEEGGQRPRSEEEELEQERKRAKLRRRLRQEGKSADEISQAVDELEQKFRAACAPAGSEAEDAPAVVDAIMIGAGAGSEVVALGAVLGVAAAGTEGEDTSESAPVSDRRPPRVRVQAVDQGSWDVLLDKMAQGLRDAWPPLDSEHVKEDGGYQQQQPRFDVRFVKGNVLDDKMITPAAGSSSSSAPMIDFGSSSLRLITICFTITELLLQSRLETLRLLSTISRSAPSGTLFLIVESASLAQIPIGQEGRTYPLGKLLDHALCGGGGAGEQGGGAWEILKSEDAKWYRMPDDADEVYNAMGKGTKVKLENSRVVLRLYRKR